MLQKTATLLSRIQLTIGFINISIFFITIIIQVFSRYLRFSVTWTQEVATYNFIWSVFMGAGVMVFEKKHFSFTLLISKLNTQNQIILKIVIDVLILVFTISLLYFGIIITHKFWNYRLISLSAVRMGYMWICVPIFGSCTAFYILVNLVDSVNKLRKKEPV